MLSLGSDPLSYIVGAVDKGDLLPLALSCKTLEDTYANIAGNSSPYIRILVPHVVKLISQMSRLTWDVSNGPSTR